MDGEAKSRRPGLWRSIAVAMLIWSAVGYGLLHPRPPTLVAGAAACLK